MRAARSLGADPGPRVARGEPPLQLELRARASPQSPRNVPCNFDFLYAPLKPLRARVKSRSIGRVTDALCASRVADSIKSRMHVEWLFESKSNALTRPTRIHGRDISPEAAVVAG